MHSRQCKTCLASNPCSLPPRPRWRGFSFALHPDPVRGFYFALMQCSHTQAFTACFVPSMQNYTAHATKQRAGLYSGISCDCIRSTAHDSRPTHADIIPPAPRWRAYTRPKRLQHIPDTTATPGRCTGRHRPLIIIMYIRGQTMPAAAGHLLPCADCWKVLTACQQHRPGAPAEGQPGGVSMLPAPGGLRSGTGSAVNQGGAASWHTTPGGAVQRQGAGAGGAEPLAAPAASLFGLSPDS